MTWRLCCRQRAIYTALNALCAMTIAFRVNEELTRVHGRRNMDFDIGLGQSVSHLK